MTFRDRFYFYSRLSTNLLDPAESSPTNFPSSFLLWHLSSTGTKSSHALPSSALGPFMTTTKNSRSMTFFFFFFFLKKTKIRFVTFVESRNKCVRSRHYAIHAHQRYPNAGIGAWQDLLITPLVDNERAASQKHREARAN